jgi:hypothetical protein
MKDMLLSRTLPFFFLFFSFSFVLFTFFSSLEQTSLPHNERICNGKYSGRRRFARALQPPIRHPDPDRVCQPFPPPIQALTDIRSIVAVHGLNGNYARSWTHTPLERNGQETLWLRDLLPTKLPNAHIMSFEYDSSTHGLTQGNVRSNASKLVQQLTNAREDYVSDIFFPLRFDP